VQSAFAVFHGPVADGGRHGEQFDVRVQSFRTVEGEVLTLLRLLDPKMIEIYG